MKTVMQTTDRTLQEVLDALIERDLIPNSRIGPIKTAIKQYAIILGFSEAAKCPMAAFHLQDATRNRLIEEKAEGAGRRNAGGLGSHAIRNLKNNVSYVIRTATNEQIIGPVPGQLASSKTANSIKTKLITTRNEWVKPNKYVLDPVPSSLAQEISDYEIWSTNGS